MEITKYNIAGGQRSFILLGNAIFYYYKIIIEKNILINIVII
jgi:hypothetical protein